jgi:hypothetical protein
MTLNAEAACELIAAINQTPPCAQRNNSVITL